MASVELYSGTNPQVVYALCDDTHGSFERGDLVFFHTTGALRIATGTSVSGIARDKYNADSTVKIGVELIDPNSIYSVRYSSTAATSDVTTQSIVGDEVGFTYTAGAHTASDTAGSPIAGIVGFDGRDPVGTSGGRILIRFIPSIIGEPAGT